MQPLPKIGADRGSEVWERRLPKVWCLVKMNPHKTFHTVLVCASYTIMDRHRCTGVPPPVTPLRIVLRTRCEAVSALSITRPSPATLGSVGRCEARSTRRPEGPSLPDDGMSWSNCAATTHVWKGAPPLLAVAFVRTTPDNGGQIHLLV